MKFQALLVLSLAYAASAQYNYYSRPLSATGYGQQMAPQMAPEMAPQMAMPVSETGYGQQSVPQTSMPMTTPAPFMPVTDRQMTREENPCSEEVLRSPEIQAFRDPLDRTSYIVCTEIDIFVRMPCATGTFFDATIRHCVPEGWVPPVCPVGLCKNSADCIIDELKNEYKCLCRVGYTGLFCETNIDECALEGNAICMKEGGQCVDQLNAFYCDFGDKIGLSLTTAIEKPCTLTHLSEGKQFFQIESPLSNFWLQCLGENRWLVSKCAEMLFWNQELRTCTIEQPIKKTGVCKTFPCKNDGACEDLGSFNFQCLCKPGFTGALCEEVIDFCLTQPCGSGRCVSHPNGYNCVCKDNVVDQSCDNGNTNPCTMPYDYLPNFLDSTKYYVCGLEGLAFVKTCAQGTFWSSEIKTCIAPERVLTSVKAPKMSIFDGMTKPQSSAPIASTSYGSYTQTRPMATPAPVTQSYESYEQQRPMATLTPMVQTFEEQRPQATPAPMVQTYEQQRPMVTPAPMIQQQRPQATPAPMVQTYEQQRPMVTPPPMVQTYEQQRPQATPAPMIQQQRPQATPAPMVQTYEQQRPQATPAPINRSYEQARPMAIPAPMTQSFGQQRPQMPRMPSVKSY